MADMLSLLSCIANPWANKIVLTLGRSAPQAVVGKPRQTGSTSLRAFLGRRGGGGGIGGAVQKHAYYGSSIAPLPPLFALRGLW